MITMESCDCGHLGAAHLRDGMRRCTRCNCPRFIQYAPPLPSVFGGYDDFTTQRLDPVRVDAPQDWNSDLGSDSPGDCWGTGGGDDW